MVAAGKEELRLASSDSVFERPPPLRTSVPFGQVAEAMVWEWAGLSTALLPITA